MSSSSINETKLYDICLENSEIFQNEISHLLQANILSKIDEILVSKWLQRDSFEWKNIASNYLYTLKKDLKKSLGIIFQPIHDTTIWNIVGDMQWDFSDMILSEWKERLIEKIEKWNLFSSIISKREEIINIIDILRHSYKQARQYLLLQFQEIEISTKSNYKDIFSRNMSSLITNSSIPSTDDMIKLSLWDLEKQQSLILDVIYNKLIFERNTKKGFHSFFLQSMHLVDEPTIKKWEKWVIKKSLHFLPIDILLTHSITSFLARWIFDIASESDIIKAEQELHDETDLLNYAEILKEQFITSLEPFISQISDKKPFYNWFLSQIDRSTILKILHFLKHASGHHKDTDMYNPYWILWLEKNIKIKKAYFLNYT